MEPRLLPAIPSRDDDPAEDFGETANDRVVPEFPLVPDDFSPVPDLPDPAMSGEQGETEEARKKRL
eukprot:7673025-Prorocentrum_lima.AAC.1